MRVVQGVRLTDTQKRVLCKIAAAPSPTVAADSVSGDQNLVGATAQLSKLGLLAQNNGLQLTDAGQNVMKDYALVDASGSLTDAGQRLAQSSEDGGTQVSDVDQQPADAAPIGGEPDQQQDQQEQPGMTSSAQGSFENYEMRSLNLLKELINL